MGRRGRMGRSQTSYLWFGKKSMKRSGYPFRRREGVTNSLRVHCDIYMFLAFPSFPSSPPFASRLS